MGLTFLTTVDGQMRQEGIGLLVQAACFVQEGTSYKTITDLSNVACTQIDSAVLPLETQITC